MTTLHPRIAAARAGTDPALICPVPSGWVFLCNMQILRGYCVLQADPVVESLNALNVAQRAQFLDDMGRVGDALMEVTGAYRINYLIAGNSDPVLHAHIVPRYLNEPDTLRKDLPWFYPNAYDPATFIDYGRDKTLMLALAEAVRKRF